MTVKKRAIGILGGMGPLATLELFKRIIAMTPAAKDQDHLRIIIDNNPAIPDRTAAIVHRGESPLPLLTKTARVLEMAGADLVAMPCNSAHYYLDALKRAVTIPVLDMIGETARAIKESHAGLLATDGVLFSRLYHDACERAGIELLQPIRGDQALVMEAIYRIKAGKDAIAFKREITGVIAGLQENGAEAVIIGCTEVSLIPGLEDVAIPVYDALNILAQTALHQALSLS